MKYVNSNTLPVVNGIHRVLLRSTTEPGTISITASAKGLGSYTLTIDSMEVEIENGVMKELPAVLPRALLPIKQGAARYGPDPVAKK